MHCNDGINIAQFFELGAFINYVSRREGVSQMLMLKSFSDAILSQQSSPKNFLQNFLSLILTNIDQILQNLIKTRKKIAKNS